MANRRLIYILLRILGDLCLNQIVSLILDVASHLMNSAVLHPVHSHPLVLRSCEHFCAILAIHPKPGITYVYLAGSRGSRIVMVE